MKHRLTIEFDNEADLRAYLDNTAPPADTDAADTDAADTKAAPTPDTAEEITADVDADGMPYDNEIHADPKSFTAAGNWRSKRGKSKEADQARADFKAGGGNVTPPEPETKAESGMPGMPGMPTGAAEVRADPVSYDQVYEKTSDMMARHVIDGAGVMALYKAIGMDDPSALNTNESYRSALYAKLCEIEAD